MGTFGDLWGPMGADGDSLASRGTFGHLWAPLGTHWAPLGAYGGLCGPMGTYWHLRGPMGTFGGLWGPMAAFGHLFFLPLSLLTNFPHFPILVFKVFFAAVLPCL